MYSQLITIYTFVQFINLICNYLKFFVDWIESLFLCLTFSGRSVVAFILYCFRRYFSSMSCFHGSSDGFVADRILCHVFWCVFRDISAISTFLSQLLTTPNTKNQTSQTSQQLAHRQISPKFLEGSNKNHSIHT